MYNSFFSERRLIFNEWTAHDPFDEGSRLIEDTVGFGRVDDVAGKLTTDVFDGTVDTLRDFGKYSVDMIKAGIRNTLSFITGGFVAKSQSNTRLSVAGVMG